MRAPAERVRDMLEAIAAIERYLHRGREGLEQDELLQCWFVHNLQIIGMRNVLVHGYFDIDTEIVWKTVSHDVPKLKSSLEKLLERLEEKR